MIYEHRPTIESGNIYLNVIAICNIDLNYNGQVDTVIFLIILKVQYCTKYFGKVAQCYFGNSFRFAFEYT